MIGEINQTNKNVGVLGLETDRSIDAIPKAHRWSFYCHYQPCNTTNYPTATFLWVEAEDQEKAIVEAERQVKLIRGGRLGFMLRGFHGMKCVLR